VDYGVKITALSNHKPAVLNNYSRIGYSFAFAATNIPFSDIIQPSVS
jgi:hypothetical protein